MQLQSTLSTELEKAIRELYALADDPTEDVAEFERRCMTSLMAVGRMMMKGRLEAVSPSSDFIEAGVHWRKAVDSRLHVMTSFGSVPVDRALFRANRNGPTRCLVAERAPLMAGFWTEQAAKVGALAVSEMPMERAEQFFAVAGLMPASRSSLLRLVGWLSDLWEGKRTDHEQAMRESTAIPESAVLVTVSLDGVMVLMTDSDKEARKAAACARGQADKGPSGWREASVGVVSFYDADGDRLQTRRYGRMPEADKATTKSWLRTELEFVRKQRPDLRVVAIADGAANNWSFLEGLGADFEVVDFFHAAEHLHRHVSKANGASSVATQKKLRKMRHDLLEKPGAAERVFNDLQQLREHAGTEAVSTTKKEGKRQPTFIERHWSRMNYAELRELHIPIGTGVTESTCKLTICDRLRRTGMRWSRRGGQAVVTLRAHAVSNAFNAAWAIVTDATHVRLAA
jgi:hypothetical protein